MSAKNLTTEVVIEDAHLAATYYRTLVAEGIPARSAVDITCSYMSGVLIARENRHERPDEPWKEDA